MKTKKVLVFFLAIMAGIILLAVVFPDQLKEFLNRPSSYPHVLFIHILAVTLFFSNAVIGILWESRSLASHQSHKLVRSNKLFVGSNPSSATISIMW